MSDHPLVKVTHHMHIVVLTRCLATYRVALESAAKIRQVSVP